MHPLIVLSCNPSIIKIYIETPILLRLKSKLNINVNLKIIIIRYKNAIKVYLKYLTGYVIKMMLYYLNN